MQSEKPLERCQYVVPRKSRTCRMLVKAGQKFCGEHSGQERNRIPCPLDPKHTVSEDDLQAHMAKCNSRLKTDLPYIRADVNGPNEESMDHDVAGFSLTQLTDAELNAAIEKVKSIWSTIEVQVEEAFLEHKAMTEALESETYGPNAKRHLKQQSSILGHADRLGLLEIGKNEDVCYVEFGAGRAKLSYWLARAVEETMMGHEAFLAPQSALRNISYLLIERSGQRYKFENKIPEDESFPQTPGLHTGFHRIRCAIEHVDLRLVDCVRRSGSCVAFCKHLCGSGTDAALRSLVNATEPNPNPAPTDLSANAPPARITAAVLAPCCHHRCDWRSFVGQKTLALLGLSEAEFKIVTSMSSWATCGLRSGDGDHGEDRKAVGRKCKLILDYARAKYLEETERFEVRLYFYVPEDVTPENLLIVVTAKST